MNKYQKHALYYIIYVLNSMVEIKTFGLSWCDCPLPLHWTGMPFCQVRRMHTFFNINFRSWRLFSYIEKFAENDFFPIDSKKFFNLPAMKALVIVWILRRLYIGKFSQHGLLLGEKYWTFSPGGLPPTIS